VYRRSGRPSVSLEALRERVERQFQEETAHRADILFDLDTEEKRRAMLAEVVDYVLAVEAITLSERDKQGVIDGAYRNLFTFGPLDAYLQENDVTAITINGPHRISVQRGMGKLELVEAAFDDAGHLESVLERVLATGGAVLPPEDDPFLETGVTLNRRAAQLSLMAPPSA
jgi:pilus assembly protein CpaF